jgi:TIR domain
MAKQTASRVRRPPTRKVPPALVFISHDSRDHALAEAFENLLRDASAGVLKTFRSSDKKGYSGIAFGAEWYATVMQRLAEATDVVALLTPNSLNRPWILYEVGVARGRSGVPAFGVACNVPFDEVTGPFSQFQNSPDDEDSLTALVMQLMRRLPDAAPREEAVRLHVAAFRAKVANLGRDSSPDDADPLTAAVLFEEVKAMFRVVSERIERIGDQSLALVPGINDHVVVSSTERFPLVQPLAGFKQQIEARLTTYARNVFVMMKYRESNLDTWHFLSDVLRAHGLVPVRADDPQWDITRDTYNPIAVLYCCRYGLALYDASSDDLDFSPNVTYELAMMHLQRKDCLILRHSSLPAARFSIIHKLHKPYSKEIELRKLVARWAEELAYRDALPRSSA